MQQFCCVKDNAKVQLASIEKSSTKNEKYSQAL